MGPWLAILESLLFSLIEPVSTVGFGGIGSGIRGGVGCQI